jgi:hypothetical protein
MQVSTSFRRKTTELRATLVEEDTRPETLRDYADLLDKVATIGISGYERVTISITGRQEELADLAEELQTWTPSSGWSEDAQKLFKMLQGEGLRD